MKKVLLFCVFMICQYAYSQDVSITIDSINYCDSVGMYQNEMLRMYRVAVKNNCKSDVLVWLLDDDFLLQDSEIKASDKNVIMNHFYQPKLCGADGKKYSRNFLLFCNKPRFRAKSFNADCLIKAIKPDKMFTYIIIGDNCDIFAFVKRVFCTSKKNTEKVLGRKIPKRVLFPFPESVLFRFPMRKMVQ